MRIFLQHISAIFAFLIFLQIPLSGQIQEESRILNGRVLDAKSGEAVHFANIKIEGKQSGTLTDADGKFTLRIPKEETTLLISHISFSKKKLVVPSDSIDYIEILLAPRDIEIDRVVITENRVELAYPDYETYVFDYELMGENLLLSVHDQERKRSRLILVNPEDSIIAIEYGPEAIASLTKDCFGNIHFLTKNYACQVGFIDGELIWEAIGIERYEESVAPCLGFLDSTAYFERFFNNQEKEYIYFRDGNGIAKALYRIEDKERVRQMRDEGLPLAGKFTIEDFLDSPLSEDPRTMITPFFLLKTFFKPIYSPLKVVGQNVLVFDHVNAKILKYDEKGILLSKTGISYHKHKKWLEEIYLDEDLDESYTVYEKFGFKSLKQIDTDTGEIIGSWEIPKQFIYKIKIRDGVAYFLYKDKLSDDVKRIYKLRLK